LINGKKFSDIWAAQDKNTVLNGPASGSDDASFLQIASVSTLKLQFQSQLYQNVYHSIYDNYNWMSQYGDKGFVYHEAICELTGIVAMRLAANQYIGYDFEQYGLYITGYIADLESKLSAYNIPANQYPNLANIKSAAVNLTIAGKKIIIIANAGYNTHSDNQIRQINDRLMLAERIFSRQDPSMGPSMYNHIIYRPEPDNQYGSEKFPSVYYHLKKGHWRNVQIEIDMLTLIIESAADYLSLTYF